MFGFFKSYSAGTRDLESLYTVLANSDVYGFTWVRLQREVAAIQTMYLSNAVGGVWGALFALRCEYPLSHFVKMVWRAFCS